MKKSLFGLPEKVVAAGAYLGLFVTGIIVFVMEKENKTLRFHGLQSTVVFGALAIIALIFGWVLGWIPLIGWLVSTIFRIVIIASCVFLAFTAYTGIKFKVPVIGEYCEAYVNKE